MKAFNEDKITEKVEHKIDKCPKCGSENLELIDTKIRDEIDIKVTVVKRRHYFNEYKCNDCNEIIKSEIPLSLHADNQYGDEVKTLATVLCNYGFVAYNRIKQIINGLTNGEINPSEGYLNKLQKKASDLLSTFTFDVR